MNEDADLTEELPVIYPNAFEDENLEQRMQAWLESKGATIIKECKLIEIISDKDKNFDSQKSSSGNLHPEAKPITYDHDCNLERIVLKRLDIPDEEEEEEEMDIDEKSQSDQHDDNGHQEESGLMDQDERSQMEDGSGN